MHSNRLIILSILLTCSLTWHETGHMLTAQIAKLTQQQESPEILEFATKILTPFMDYCGEKLDSFVEAATWPDKIREDGNDQMFSFHFIDTLFSLDGTNVSYDAQIENHNSFNVTKQIELSVESLKTPDDHAQKGPRWGHEKPVLMKSLMLRNLIHFVGDVHQPLHASTAVFEGNELGDQGGNLFKTFWKNYDSEGGNNLHFYWDHMFYQYDEREGGSGELLSPFRNEDMKKNSVSYAQEIINEFKKSSYEEERLVSAPMEWANESTELGKNFVYKGLEMGKEMNNEYVKKAQKIARERVALGGYRLAEILKKAFNNDEIVKRKAQISVIDE